MSQVWRATEGDGMTYKIVRFYSPDRVRRTGVSKRTIETGLTLEEAQAHCQREDTRGHDWFDGYTRDDR